MAWQAKRSRTFRDDFELVDENGNVVHTIHVSLDADDMTVKISRKYTALVRAMSETTEMKRKAESAEELENCMEKLGQAVIDMLEAVFGEEDTKSIVEFYENRYIEMSREVLPFISQVVIPRMQELAAENRKSIRQKYNRKTRRRLGLI